MAFSFKRGFTLIELLVVIAIIGILSSIVLSSLNTARNKGGDAAVKSNLEQARTQSELFYDSNGNHYVTVGGAGTATDLCSALATGASTGGVKGIYASVFAAADAAGVSAANVRTTLTSTADVSPYTKATCHSCYANQGGTTCATTHTDMWVVTVPLKSDNTQEWCVDSTGKSNATVNATANGVATCT